MEKDFDNWNILKKQQEGYKNQIFEENQIWWTNLGVNAGSEACGKNDNFNRPVLVVRKFNKSIFLGVPLSTKIKEGRFYHNFTLKGKESSALLSQIRLLDSKRLTDLIGKISDKEIGIVRGKIKDLI